MKLFEMYEFMRFIVDKDYEGNAFTPDQFADLCTVANLELFKIKMGLPEDYAPGQPFTRQHFDATQMMTDDTKFLRGFDAHATLSSGILVYPDSYFTLNSLRHIYQRNVDGVATDIPRLIEVLTEDEYSSRAGNWLKRPTTWDAVAVIREDGIHIFPDTINEVEVAYIRYPTSPKFSYVLKTGYIEADEFTSVDFEWPEHLHMDLVRIMLSFVGINLRDEQLFQYAEAKKAAGV